MKLNLNRREKYAVTAAGICVSAFVIMQFIIFPFLDKRDLIQRRIKIQNSALNDMLVLSEEYRSLNQKIKDAEKMFSRRPSGFTLFSFLDQLAGKAKIKKYIGYMKPSKINKKGTSYKISRVEMKFKAIDLKELTPFLYWVETSRNMVYIKRMVLSKTGKGNKVFIDVVLLVETYEV